MVGILAMIGAVITLVGRGTKKRVENDSIKKEAAQQHRIHDEIVYNCADADNRERLRNSYTRDTGIDY